MEQLCDLSGELLFLLELSRDVVLHQNRCAQTFIDRHAVGHELTVQPPVLEVALGRVFHLNS